MLLRRLIALLCTSVYLLAAGGAAVVSLSCPCSALHHHSEQCNHTTHHLPIDHHAVQSGPVEAIESDCCDDRHTNDRQLYTAGEKETARRIYRSAVQLQEVLLGTTMTTVAEAPCSLIHASRCDHTPSLRPCEASCRLLRAPPVTA